MTPIIQSIPCYVSLRHLPHCRLCNHSGQTTWQKKKKNPQQPEALTPNSQPALQMPLGPAVSKSHTDRSRQRHLRKWQTSQHKLLAVFLFAASACQTSAGNTIWYIKKKWTQNHFHIRKLGSFIVLTSWEEFNHKGFKNVFSPLSNSQGQQSHNKAGPLNFEKAGFFFPLQHSINVLIHMEECAQCGLIWKWAQSEGTGSFLHTPVDPRGHCPGPQGGLSPHKHKGRRAYQ